MIAIIGAMKVEIDALLDRMSEVQACPVQKISFYTGKLAGEPVVVTQSGVGKTLAAMSTTLLLEHFDVDGVINIGTAGVNKKPGEDYIPTLPQVFMTQKEFECAKKMADAGVEVFAQITPSQDRMNFKDIEKIFAK